MKVIKEIKMEKCIECGVEIVEEEVVWIRKAPPVDGDWNKAQCMECWEKENPGREAVFIK